MMNNFKKIQKGALVIVAVLLASITGCDTTGLQNSIDNFALVIGLEEINTGSTVLLTDAATGELINTTVSVTFEGQNGADVIDMYSDPIAGVDVDDGILNFAINNSVEPTGANPATVKLRLEADGYMTAIKTVEMTETGFTGFTFTMVDENNKPEGLTDFSGSASTNADGSLASELEVVSGDTTTADFSTTISIPEGTVFEDENGNTLTGNITASMIYYDPTERSAMENLPFDTDIFQNDADSVTIILGVTPITITDQQGKVAAKVFTFGKNKRKQESGINVTTRIGGRLDLTSQKIDVNTISDGDKNKQNSTKTCEPPPKGCTVESRISTRDLNPGKVKSPSLPVVSVTLPPPGDDSESSTKIYNQLIVNHNGHSGTIEYNSAHDGKIATTPLTAELMEDADQTTITPLANNSTSNYIRSFSFLKGSMKNKIIITSPVEYTHTLSNPLPSGNSITIDLPQKPANSIDSEVSVKLQCSNPDERASITTIPQASLVFRKAGSSDNWKVIPKINWDYNEEEQVLTGGSVTVPNVEQGVDYNFKLSFDGNTEDKIINISGTTVQVTLSDEIDSICN